MASYDWIGDIAILKFSKDAEKKEKKEYAEEFLKKNKGIKTILEKAGRIKGRLRIAGTRFLAGKDRRETIYIENGCRFKINVDETYFSTRLANQRQKIAEEIARKVTKKKNKILVMFAGIAPFPIVIAKKLKDAGKKAKIISNEINRKASRYAEENVRLNKFQDYIKVVQGDSKKLPAKLKERFDFIVMPRPNLKDTFLDIALKFSKKGARIYYYGFGTKEKVLEEIKRDAGKKAGKIKIEKAGEIAPYKYRWLARFKILFK